MVEHSERIEKLQQSFSRRERCVLGLPFDVVTESEATQILADSVAVGRRCFLSTPNLNFAVSALRDASFRESVFESDLSVADGMPLILLSRMLGEPLPERVAGSSLFETMRSKASNNRVSVFFFGGMGDTAERASKELDHSEGMNPVGALNPGMGTIEEMSSDEIIETINRADPDFLVVSLGAKKGQSWIVSNQDALNARVISHLGAVVNFVAGSVKRAPAIWQRLGLEWVWRILEEPSLWKRYWSDGITLIQVVMTRVLPLAIYSKKLAGSASSEDLDYSVTSAENRLVISLSGNANEKTLSPLKAEMSQLMTTSNRLTLDLKNLESVDSSFWALLIRVRAESMKFGLRISLENVTPSIRKHAKLSLVEQILELSA